MAREQALRLAREKDQNAKDAMLEKMSADMAARQKEVCCTDLDHRKSR